ncbi:MAG: hypothetical protein Kow0063_05430 [Anaerolineae bacterium]
MTVHADDRVLVAIMNNQRDWARVQDEGWYRIPVKHAPPGATDFDWLAFYFTKAFGDDRWAIHYYAPIQGHELVTRRDLIPSEPDHPRAAQWYYKLQLGRLEHKLPPIVAHRWRRVTFIVTSGDRFINAHEINDLFEQESPAGQLYVRLREMGIQVEREWWIDEEGTAYVVDLALPVKGGWLPVIFGDRPGPAGGLRFAAEAEPEACLQEVRTRLRAL